MPFYILCFVVPLEVGNKTFVKVFCTEYLKKKKKYCISGMESISDVAGGPALGNLLYF